MLSKPLDKYIRKYTHVNSYVHTYLQMCVCTVIASFKYLCIVITWGVVVYFYLFTQEVRTRTRIMAISSSC